METIPGTSLNVSISSIRIDLPEYRAAVRDAILTLSFHPDGMKHWPVGWEKPVTLCQQKVAHADVYLGIYAHRYNLRLSSTTISSMSNITDESHNQKFFVWRQPRPKPVYTPNPM